MSAARTVVYGIPNCDTVKKARTWLQARGVPFEFHDFKKAGLTASLVNAWLADVPLELLLNRRGTTWRGLSDAAKAAAETQDARLFRRSLRNAFRIAGAPARAAQ